MNIVTEKELNYIETLYVYANLQDFVSHTKQEEYKSISERDFEIHIDELGIETFKEAVIYHTKKYCYDFMFNYVVDTILSSSKFLGVSHGREWYDLGYCRIGIMDFHVALKANQFNVEIQYSQSHMFSLGDRLEGLVLPFEGDMSQYHVKRIDLTKVVKTKNDYLTNHSFISPYRSISRFGTDVLTETIYLGARSNGNVFRMYNKTIELQVDNKDHPIDYAKIELFSKYFGDIEDLYTFELELHRKYFKAQFDIDTLVDLDKIYQAYFEIVGKIKIYEDNDYNRKLVLQKHYSRISDVYRLTDYVECKRVVRKKYKPSEEYLINKIVVAIQRYENSLSVKLLEHEKLILSDKILTAVFGKRDISIEIEDDKDEISYNAFLDKVNTLRFNQDDQLFKESNRAFAPIYMQKPDDLF